MKDKSFKQPQPATRDYGPEWITKAKVQEIYPHIRDRHLKHWRESKQVRYKTFNRNFSIYIESDIHAQVEHCAREKKRARVQYVRKKLATIDVGIMLMILAVGLAFAYYKPWEKKQTYSMWDFYYPLLLIFFFAVVYWIVKLIRYLYRRFIGREKE